MQKSGWFASEANEIIVCGLKNYEKKIKILIKEGRPLHRPGVSTVKTRIKKKILEKTTWFRKGRESDEDNDEERLSTPRDRKNNRKTPKEKREETIDGYIATPEERICSIFNRSIPEHNLQHQKIIVMFHGEPVYWDETWIIHAYIPFNILQ